jgi:hypothetical protein
MAGWVLISVRSWSSTARHSTWTVEIAGVLNSSAASTAVPAKSKTKAASERATNLTAPVPKCVAPRRQKKCA